MTVIINGTTGITNVNGTAAAPAETGADTDSGIVYGTNTVSLATNGTTAVTVDASQNVGIGTVSPGYKLQVVGSVAASTQVLGPNGSAATPSISSTGETNAGLFFGDNGVSSYMGMSTGGSERMRLLSTGELVVGTTSIVGAEQLGIVFSDPSGKGGLGVQVVSNASGAVFAAFRNSAGTLIGSVARVTTTNAVVYNTTSDQRLKSNISDANTVLDKLMAVKVRQFDWTEGDLHQDYGFIAQELEPTLSGLVTKGKTNEDMWQVDYSRLTPHLVKAIQEQQAFITALTARITALENK